MVDIAFIMQTLGLAITVSTPLLIAALGESFAERSGVMNLSIEGVMSLGAALGYLGAAFTGNLWIGVLLGLCAGMLIALVNAYVSQTLYVNQVVSGMALYIFAWGLSVFIFRLFTGGGWVWVAGITIPRFEPVQVPLPSQLEALGPVVRQNALVYIFLLLTIVAQIVMFKTTFGLNVRAVGENPEAADNAGIGVHRTRYMCLMLGGAAAGVAGAYLALAELGFFFEGMTAGRGWIAIALVIFGQWRPLRILAGSLIFGVLESSALHVMVTMPNIPYMFLLAAPYALSIAILVLAFRRAILPAGLFKPYNRESVRR